MPLQRIARIVLGLTTFLFIVTAFSFIPYSTNTVSVAEAASCVPDLKINGSATNKIVSDRFRIEYDTKNSDDDNNKPHGTYLDRRYEYESGSTGPWERLTSSDSFVNGAFSASVPDGIERVYYRLTSYVHTHWYNTFASNCWEDTTLWVEYEPGPILPQISLTVGDTTVSGQGVGNFGSVTVGYEDDTPVRWSTEDATSCYWRSGLNLNPGLSGETTVDFTDGTSVWLSCQRNVDGSTKYAEAAIGVTVELPVATVDPSASLLVKDANEAYRTSITNNDGNIILKYVCENSTQASVRNTKTGVLVGSEGGTQKFGTSVTIEGEIPLTISESSTYELECRGEPDTAPATATASATYTPPPAETAEATVVVSSQDQTARYSIYVDGRPKVSNEEVNVGSTNSHTVTVKSSGSTVAIASVNPSADEINFVRLHSGGGVSATGTGSSISGIKDGYTARFSLTYDTVEAPSLSTPTTRLGESTCVDGAPQNTVVWEDSNIETGYRIYRWSANTSSSFARLVGSRSQNATSFVDTSVGGGLTYNYRVEAYNSTETASDDRSVTTVINCDPEELGQVSIRVTNATCLEGEPRNTLTWNDVDNENGYRIYRWPTHLSSGFKTMVGATGRGETAFSDRDATSGQTYYYRVEAWNHRDTTKADQTISTKYCEVDNSATISISTEETATVTIVASGLSAETIPAGQSRTYTVEPHQNGQSYSVQASPSPSRVVHIKNGGSEIERNWVTLQPGDDASFQLSYPDEPPPPTVEPPTPPSSVSANAYCSNNSPRVDVSWSSVSDAESYHLSKSSGGSFSALQALSGTSYTDAAVQSGSTYRYSVGTSNENGNSDTETISNSVTVPSCQTAAITLSISPTTTTIDPGDDPVFTIGINRNNTGSRVALNAGFSPAAGTSLTLNPSGATSGSQKTLTANTQSTIRPGTYTVSVGGTAIGSSISISDVEATVIVRDSAFPPPPPPPPPSQGATVHVTVRDSNGASIQAPWSITYDGTIYSGNGSGSIGLDTRRSAPATFNSVPLPQYSGYTVTNSRTGQQRTFPIGPKESVNVTLTYENISGPSSCSFDFTSDKYTVTPNEPFRLTWGNAEGVIGPLQGSGAWNRPAGQSGTDSARINNIGEYTYVLSGTCRDGSPVSRSLTIAVVSDGGGSASTVSIDASPNTVGTSPEDITISWDLEKVSRCQASGSWNGSKSATDGRHSETLANQIAPLSYTLTCEAENGTDISDTAYVSLLPATFDIAHGGGITLDTAKVESTRTTIRVIPVGNFSDDITLSVVGVSPNISGYTVRFSDPILTQSQGVFSSSDMWIEVPEPLSRNDYSVTIRATGGGESDTLTIPLNSRGDVPSFEEF